MQAEAMPMSHPADWIADQGDGSYRNPIIYADYSDLCAACLASGGPLARAHR